MIGIRQPERPKKLSDEQSRNFIKARADLFLESLGNEMEGLEISVQDSLNLLGNIAISVDAKIILLMCTRYGNDMPSIDELIRRIHEVSGQLHPEAESMAIGAAKKLDSDNDAKKAIPEPVTH